MTGGWFMIAIPTLQHRDHQFLAKRLYVYIPEWIEGTFYTRAVSLDGEPTVSERFTLQSTYGILLYQQTQGENTDIQTACWHLYTWQLGNDAWCVQHPLEGHWKTGVFHWENHRWMGDFLANHVWWHRRAYPQFIAIFAGKRVIHQCFWGVFSNGRMP